MLPAGQPERLTEIRTLARKHEQSIQEVRTRIREAQDHLAPLIAFVHVPKTAGGTATNMLSAAYSRSAVQDVGNYLKDPERSENKLRRRLGHWHDGRVTVRVAVGHVPYGILLQYLPGGTRYMTFLREPADRVISYYYSHMRLTGTARDERRRERGRLLTATVEEALRTGAPELNNLATRLLSGQVSPMEEISASALHDAKANLRQFAFVGLQERFEESIVLLQRILHLDLVPYFNRHVGIERPSLEEVPDEQRALIAEHNALDIELYAFAQQLFEESIASEDESLTADATRLRALSDDASDSAVRQAREWLDVELPIGTTRPKDILLAAAKEAGVPLAGLDQVSKHEVEKEDRGGQMVWTRTESGRRDQGDPVKR